MVPWRQGCNHPTTNQCIDWFTLPVPTSSQSPNFWASRNHQNMNLFILLRNILTGLVFKIGSSYLLDPTLNTSPKPYLQKGLPCRHPWHTWDLGLGTPCEVVCLNLHALIGWDCMISSQVSWVLGLGTRANRPLVPLWVKRCMKVTMKK